MPFSRAIERCRHLYFVLAMGLSIRTDQHITSNKEKKRNLGRVLTFYTLNEHVIKKKKKGILIYCRNVCLETLLLTTTLPVQRISVGKPLRHHEDT